jgi:hypothetical protein
MTISATLITRYTTEVSVDWHNAFVLYHPLAGTKYLIDHTTEFWGAVDGWNQLFQPVPAKIVPAARDDSGRQDMSIVWCGIQDEALTFLDAAAADPTQAVTCRYSIFIDGSVTAQIDPWVEFMLTSISVSKEAVTAMASRADILNRPFPTVNYRVDTYPGLRRR